MSKPVNRRPADLARWVQSLTPAQRARFQTMLPNAPSVRYARSPQWQAFARSFLARTPALAAMRGKGDSAVGVLYGVLRDLGNPAHEHIYREAFRLPKTATRRDVLDAVLRAAPELQAFGDTPAKFEQALSQVATMSGFEQLNLKRLQRDIEQQNAEGRSWDGAEKARSEADRKRIADESQRRALIGNLYAEAKARIPPHRRGVPGSHALRPNSERMAELQAQAAAFRGERALFDKSSQGYREWNARHEHDGDAIGARREEIQQAAEAERSAVEQAEASLRDTPAEAEATAEEWERANYGRNE